MASSASPDMLPLTLPGDYLPPYPTDLGIDSFIHQPGTQTYTVDGLDHAAHAVCHELEVIDPDHVRCHTNGSPTQHWDPHTHRCTGPVASLLEWYDWILAEDAVGRRLLSQDTYGGDTVEGMLFRAEHGLVGFDQAERCLNDLPATRSLHEWLTHHLAETRLTVSVVGLQNMTGTLHMLNDLAEPVTGDQVTAPLKDNGMLRWLPMPYAVDPELLAGHPHAEQFSSMVRTGFDGPHPSWVHAIWFVPRSLLGPDSVQTVITDDGSDHAWWGVLLDPFDVCLVIPRHPQWPMNVRAGTDADGSQAWIQILPTTVAAEQNKTDDTHTRRWGRWLDPSVILTDAELAEGIRRTENLLDDQFQERTR